ncbi:TIR domain-containing protein [Neptuniibacter sp. QD34_54]|uniref:TIR domain-containing protein n=1 Tax=Neptuniibacter sp. QD34_54 TaxID=3398208 RepID=UPI0039F459D8
MSQRHKVFVSYHHANDQEYREYFEEMFSDFHDVLIPQSVQIGEIDTGLSDEKIRQIIRDDYLRDSTVTVVLIGSQTWQRKHVDWEIASSIRNTKRNPRSGLLGIILPSYKPQTRSLSIMDRILLKNAANDSTTKYLDRTIPPRLADNIKCGYSKIYSWTNDPFEVQDWIHEAFESRHESKPNNSLRSFKQNRSGK